MSVPYPDPVVIALLAELPGLDEIGGRISTSLDSTLPALRVTKVADLEPPTSEEATPIFQVEIWADDEFVAGDLAWRLKDIWPFSVPTVVGSALVHGRWVEASPFPQPDSETEKPRFLISLGIRLSGAS